MSVRVVDDFSSAWAADATGLWTATVGAEASRFGGGTGMRIAAVAGAAGPPHVQRVYVPGLDLRDMTELRLWVRSSRPATGSPSQPYYLAIEAAASPDDAPAWLRLIRIGRAEVWELQHLFLGDLPADLRQAVGVLRLRSLDPAVAFSASVDQLCACTPEAIIDTEAALLDLLHERFTVAGVAGKVPAIMQVPGDVDGIDPPYILISPWVAAPVADEGREVVDNETPSGFFVRPQPRRIRLDYRIEVHATERAHQARLLEAVVAELSREPGLVIGNEPVKLVPFEPDELATGPVRPGVTPLYYRLTAWYEAGPRVRRSRAVPVLVTGTELVSV